MDVPGYATLSGLRRGPKSCGSRSRGSERSSNRFLTRSEIKEALRGATSELVGDLTQQIRAKVEPLIPPQALPTILGVSPHRAQANHLVAGLTNTLGSLRGRPMPTPAVIPRSPFVPRTAQPPYSHVGNSTRAELDLLGLTALGAMVDVEPYGSSDLGGDPYDDEPPFMTSASPSEDDNPEDPENPSGRKKKKKRKTRHLEGRRSQEAKAIATSEIVVNLPEFTGKDLSEFAENFGRFLRMTGQTHGSGRVKCNLLLQCCNTKYLEKQVKQIVNKSATFADVLVALERQYPTYETDFSIRAEIQNLAVLPNNPKPGRVSELLADLDHWAGRLTPGSYSSDDLLFRLVAKLPRELWDECRSTAERKARALNYEDFCVLLLEMALEKESDQHLNAYRPRGGGSGSHGKGYQGPRPGQGTTPKHARIMDNVKKLFWCDARDDQGHLQHAPDCEQRDCFVVQGKKQETNTGAKANMPDHYRCTITCAFRGKRKHYEDECYHKQRLSAKRNGEDLGKGSGKGGGKGNGNDSGKGKSKGRGKGKDKNQGGRGGGANRQPDKDNKDPDKNGGNPDPNPRGTSQPSGWQSGPTTRSQTQAQREEAAKREHEGGDDGNAKKRSRFMRMARKLRNKRFEVTCPAEFCRGRSGGALDLVFWVRIRLGGREYLGVLDTGAIISIVAKKILPFSRLKNTMATAAIRMGDGHVVHSCGDCEVEVPMGSRTIAHRFYVMDTEAFDFVLGPDFFVQHFQIQCLTLQAPSLLYVDHGNGRESVPLEQSEHTSTYLRVSKEAPLNMRQPPKLRIINYWGTSWDKV